MRSANERLRYNLTSSLIGRAHTQMIPEYEPPKTDNVNLKSK